MTRDNLAKIHNDFCEYCLLEKGFAKGTIKNYKYSWRVLNKAYAFDSLEKINEHVLRQFFYKGQKEKNWTKNTVLHHRKNLIPFFSWCVSQNYLIENPFQNIKRPKTESEIPEHFTDREIEEMMYWAREYPYRSIFIKKRNYTLLSTLLLTGLRKEELLKLKLPDVMLEEMKLKIRAHTSKSKRDRVVPIPQRLKDIMLEYIEERKKLKKRTLYFFTSSTLDKGYTNSGLKRLLKLIQKDTGIYIHTHKFRHTFATKSLESGIDIKTLQELMGHNSIRSTAIYLHTTVEHLHKEIEKNKINCIV